MPSAGLPSNRTNAPSSVATTGAPLFVPFTGGAACVTDGLTIPTPAIVIASKADFRERIFVSFVEFLAVEAKLLAFPKDRPRPFLSSRHKPHR